MSHLNYFTPYQSKSERHEDQLTRAYLVVLKYSPAAFMQFYSYCVEAVKKLAQEQQLTISLTGVHELPLQDMNIETQVSSITIDTNRVMSVLITNKSDTLWGQDNALEISNRKARYDGVVEIGNDITMLIENKPDHRNIWPKQLNPSGYNLPEGTPTDTLIPLPALLEWRQIIQQLNILAAAASVSGMEKMLISDFLAFVDQSFTGLNPYNKLSLCKNDSYLLTQRIKNLLETKFPDNNPGYHRGWAHYIMANQPEVKQIGVRLDHNQDDSDNWKIEISMYFGDIMSQARSLYHRMDLDFTYLQKLRKNGWATYTNPHISMQSKNWYFFNNPENSNVEQYVSYWQHHMSELKQYSKSDLNTALQNWQKQGLIQMDESIKNDYDHRLRNVQDETKFNWCPGFRILYFIPAKEAIRLDESDMLSVFLKEKFEEGLRLLGPEKTL